MPVAFNFRTLVRQVVPAPVTRAVRGILVWKRWAKFRPYAVTKTVQGETFQFLIGDATAKLWYSGENHEWWPELGFIRDRMLSQDDLAFEVGSHHGFHTLFLAHGSARVVAIEPNLHNVKILRQNLELNGLKNVTVLPIAIGDSAGHISLPKDSCEGGVLLQNTENLSTSDARLLPLDQLAQEYGFPQFVKIDVEGYEDRVLKGASKILERRPKIAIEVHVDWVSRYGSSVGEVIELLNLPSYEVWILPQDTKQVIKWEGKDFATYPPPKFHLFLLPR
jgi:FkbM family methyltransferase